MEDAPKYWKFPNPECSDIRIRLPTTQIVKIMVQYGRSSRSSWTKSVWSSCGRTVMGKAIWENPIDVWLGESFLLGILIRTPWKRIIFLFVYVDDINLTRKKQNIDPMWKVLNKRSWFGRTNIFPWPCMPGMCSKAMWNKRRYWQLQNHVWIANFRGSNWKINMLGKSEYFIVVIWRGGSCQEMCGKILWVGKQDDSTTLQSINSMHWWPSFQRRRIEIRGRIVKSMLSNCSEMLIRGINWKTRHYVVGQQTCKGSHKMDQSLLQTIISFDLSHSSYMWVQTILSCGKHCQTMQTGTVSRLRFCKRSWGYKIYIRWNIVHFGKSYVGSNQLDV